MQQPGIGGSKYNTCMYTLQWTMESQYGDGLPLVLRPDQCTRRILLGGGLRGCRGIRLVVTAPPPATVQLHDPGCSQAIAS
jgi:hypothetical protein